ncbi:MAG TPA: RnfABCDGE type electron transport complex subunit B [Candidatus Limnocylindria bacterium]|nr:RnfABCDGE type electron transport complex subunit B [Candidatus Limnocylindria bacterium]
MNYTAILYAVAALGGLGILFGLLLTFASKKFAVPVDERFALVREAVAGANCGACGYPGCDPYSHAVVKGERIDLCTPGGQKTIDALSKIMGQEAPTMDVQVSRVLCQGEKGVVKPRFDYNGLATCHTAVSQGGGPNLCVYSCVGYGDCVKVCRFDAMHIENGIVVIDEDKCTACGMCVKECPRSVLKMLPKAARVTVRCQNQYPPRESREACDRACIACRRCEKACNYDAIHVINNCAIIDPSKCTLCGECVKVCPTKCIEQLA